MANNNDLTRQQPEGDIVVAALYKFVALPDFAQLREPLLALCVERGVKGTLLLAEEGINGTIAGTRDAIDAVLEWLRADSRFADLEVKESIDSRMPFYRTKVKLKKEIVTMGIGGIDPRSLVGHYVEPEQWNALISDPEVTVIDTRNDYECEIGQFEGAINPDTTTFRELPGYVDRTLDPSVHKKVAMYCTGGIRCEKSTAYLLQQGYEEVYHLKGGILNYLEKVPAEESLWRGECFVFDNRVTVDHDLNPGSYDQCHGCRFPITDADKASPYFSQGICCPRCYDTLTAEQRERFAERQKQIELARERNEPHIGAPPPSRQRLED